MAGRACRVVGRVEPGCFLWDARGGLRDTRSGWVFQEK